MFVFLHVLLAGANGAPGDLAERSTFPGRRRSEGQRVTGTPAHYLFACSAIPGGPPWPQWPSIPGLSIAAASFPILEFDRSENASARSDLCLTRSQAATTGQAEARCIHELFEQQVERAPRAIAVACFGEHLNYGELNRRANQLAHHLQKLGVGPEVIVGICLPRSLEMIIAVLGVLKAGGAYLPMDPNSPKRRLQFVLRDGRPRVLLTQQVSLKSLGLKESTSPALAREGLMVICLDRDGEIIAREPATNPASEVAPANIVYVIHLRFYRRAQRRPDSSRRAFPAQPLFLPPF